MKRTTVAFALIACGVLAQARAQEKAKPDAPRVSGTLAFTCKPDERSKAAGATAFDDTLTLSKDRVTSKLLSDQGFDEAPCKPKVEGDLVTFNATFQKPGATAKYSVKQKKDGTISGAHSRTEGDKTFRYTLSNALVREAPDQVAAAGKGGARGAALLDPAVLGIEGQMIRLLNAQVALVEANVKADKQKVAEILRGAGNDLNELRISLAKGTIAPAYYATQAQALLDARRQALEQLLGAEATAAVNKSYEKPFTGASVYLNQIRAALARMDQNEGTKRAANAIQQRLATLAELTKQPAQRTPQNLQRLREVAYKDVIAVLTPQQRKQFDAALSGMNPGAADVVPSDAGGKPKAK